MGRIVAISSGDLESTKSINEYAIRLIHSESRNVLFLGTASKDSQGYIEGITEVFAQFGCQVRSLQLVTKNYTYEEIRAQIEWADIIYVGGGDTIFMGNVWKKYGADKVYDFSLGNPDLPPPPQVKEALLEIAQSAQGHAPGQVRPDG